LCIVAASRWRERGGYLTFFPSPYIVNVKKHMRIITSANDVRLAGMPGLRPA